MNAMRKGFPLKTFNITLCLVYCIFVIGYGSYARNKVKEAVKEHAGVMAGSLWDLDPQAPSEYIKAVMRQYGYESVVVTDNEGSIFIKREIQDHRWLELFLINIKLIPRVPVVSDVVYEGNVIGKVKVIWHCTTLYLYLYVLLVLGLMLMVLQLYNRILKEKRELEYRVEERATDLRRTNEELMESEERFRTLVSNIPGAVYRCACDRDWTMEYMSDEVANISGYPASDFLDNAVRSFASIIHPEDRKKLEDVISESVDESLPFTLEYRILHKNGDVRWVFEKGQATKDISGRVLCLDGVVLDVTERKQAEKALESLATTFSSISGKEFFNKVAKHLAKTLESDYALIGKLEENEDKVKVIGGFSKGQVLEPFEYDLADTPCANVMGKTLCCYPRGVREQFPKDQLLAEMGIDGYIGSPLFDKSGKALGIMVILDSRPIINQKMAEDLFHVFDDRVSAEIERLQAETALRESEQKFKEIFNQERDFSNILVQSSPAFFVAIDGDGKVIMMNDSMLETLGYTLDEVKDKDYINYFVPQSDWPAVKEQFETLSKCVGPTLNENKILTRDGRELLTEWHGQSLCDADGELDFFFGVGMDITERRKVEAELEEYREHLKELVRKRTEELEAVNAELKDFAYVVSHDLKAPLRAMSQLAGWLSQDYVGALDDEGKKMMDMLAGRAKRMHALVEGILQYSKVGRAAEKTGQINLNDLVKNVIDMVAPPDAVQVTIENELPVLVGEKTRLSQVFQNLLSNAVKFMDKPGGEIKISCADEGPYWKFSISDNGPGIEGKYFEKIFQLFQTLTPRDQFENTGIGLSLVKRIVELNGGKIWVESKVGQGSTFFFTLPKREERDENKKGYSAG